MKQNRPKIVCLCGSTRFAEVFAEVNKEKTLAGKIVLTVGFFGHFDPPNPDQKHLLDELHLAKIDLADEVFVLNVGGYIGASTQREIAYAIATSKPVTFYDPHLGEVYQVEHAHELGAHVGGFLMRQLPKGFLTETPSLGHHWHDRKQP